jgi:hypothetical protein
MPDPAFAADVDRPLYDGAVGDFRARADDCAAVNADALADSDARGEHKAPVDVRRVVDEAAIGDHVALVLIEQVLHPDLTGSDDVPRLVEIAPHAIRLRRGDGMA